MADVDGWECLSKELQRDAYSAVLNKLVEKQTALEKAEARLTELEAENGRLRKAHETISELDYKNAATNMAAFDAVCISTAAIYDKSIEAARSIVREKINEKNS